MSRRQSHKTDLCVCACVCICSIRYIKHACDHWTWRNIA